MKHQVKLVLCEPDGEFVELFLNYVRMSDYAGVLQIKVFTHCTHLGELIEEQALDTDIFVVASSFVRGQSFAAQQRCIVVLTEQDQVEHLVENGVYMNKYQSLRVLLDRILAQYMEERADCHVGGLANRSAIVLSVFSAVGGSGKTTAAVNLAKQLAERGMHVFYLNLELYASFPVFAIDEGGDDFAKLVYYAKTNPQLVPAKLNLLKKRHPVGKFDYIQPLSNRRELEQLTANDAAVLIESLQKLELYEAVIIDLESSLHERMIGAFQMSDRIWWLLLDDVQAIYKTRQNLADYRLLHRGEFDDFSRKVEFVLNKKTQMQMSPAIAEQFKLAGQLPYIPQWKCVQHSDQLLTDNSFNEQLMACFYRETGKQQAS